MGGTEVFGNSFDDQAYCLLDGIVIKPIIVNSTFILCQSPAHKAGLDYSFELEFNDFVYQKNVGLSYSYYNDVQINYLDPAYISIDAGTKKVIVTIHGYGFGFMNASMLLVRVNDNLRAPITFYAPNVL